MAQEIYDMIELRIPSTLDGTMQPSLFWEADSTNGPKPMIVGLHTWSYDRFNQINGMLPWAKKLGWHLLLPEFRGPNRPTNPKPMEACGSHLAKQDIVDAVNFVKTNYTGKIDTSNIFLVGGSGGGHMALLMAGYAPTLWRAVASFCPITSVEAWYREKYQNPVGANYAVDIAACCGGEPSPATAEEYRYRSPITYIPEIARSNTSIWHGVFDPSVPCHHGFDVYAQVQAQFPGSRVFLHMFDGRHDLRLDLAEEWLLSQYKPAVNKDATLTG